MQDQREKEMTLPQAIFFFLVCVALSLCMPLGLASFGNYMKQPVLLQSIEFTGLAESQHHFVTPVEKFPKTCLFPELLVISPEYHITKNTSRGEILLITLPSEEIVVSLLYTCDGLYNVTIPMKLLPIQKESILRPMEIGFISILCTFLLLYIMFGLHLIFQETNNRKTDKSFYHH